MSIAFNDTETMRNASPLRVASNDDDDNDDVRRRVTLSSRQGVDLKKPARAQSLVRADDNETGEETRFLV